MQLRQVPLTLMAVSVLAVGSAAAGGLIHKVAAAAKPADISRLNQVLLAAASPFEDLTEAALANDTRGMRQALKACNDQAEGVNQVLAAPARREMAALLAAIRQAESRGEHHSVALHAVEAYRVLVESLNPEALVVPIQVAKLDYAGFKLKVLLAASPPDWPAIQKTGEEAAGLWHVLEPQIGDKGLRDAVNTVITGLNRAAGANNAEMTVFAAQMDLALVDLLEGYFERARK
jgi:hypothetical protein